MPTAVDQRPWLEADWVRNAPSWRRRGDSGPLRNVEHHDSRDRGVWPGNELLRGEPRTVARPYERARLDLQRATHGFAVEYQLAVLRASHPQLFRPPDAGA